MDNYIKDRCISIGKDIIDTKLTVRQLAVRHGVSKSTVHNDLTVNLLLVSPFLAREAKKVLDEHREIRHILGGYATKQQWKMLKSQT